GRMHVPRRREPDHIDRCCTSARTGNRRTEMPEPTFDELIDAMKDAAAVLQEADVPFVLGGGVAAWARGGPRSEHDIDLLVLPADVDRALAAFEEAGFRVERPPEGW